jgi:transposase
MTPPFEVADVFRRHAQDYRREHAGRLGRAESRVISAIQSCRTAALGGHVEGCDDCGALRIAYNSCRNRHCPKCQGQAREAWLAARQSEVLPVPYFHVVFTLPPEAAEIAFQNKARVYALLMRAAAGALSTLAAEPRRLGAEIGILAVLHTWGQTLTHHPHVHCVVPGGGLSLDGKAWIACKPGFFLPVRALSRLFRRLFLAGLETAFQDASLGFFGDLSGLAEPNAFAAASGSSMPSRRSAGRRRFWPISPDIPTAPPSPTRASSRSARTRSPSPTRISAEQLAALSEVVETGPDRANDGVVRWRRIDLKRVVEERFGVVYHERTIGKILKQIGFSHISARPRHPGQNAETIAAFKKISRRR